MKTFTKTTIAAVCLLAITPSFANDSKLEEIVVTAKGDQTEKNSLFTAHVFTADEIEAAQTADIPDFLDQITGLSVRDSGGRGSATGVFLRGVASSQTIVLIDGVRVGSATLGSAALNQYPIEAIERIEVLKGPFSGIYGADAVGGVIQIFTKKGKSEQSSVRATIGSNGLKEFGLGLGYAGEKGSFHLGLQKEDKDGIDRTSILENGNDDIDGYEQQSLSLGGEYAFSDRTNAKLSVLSTDSTVDFDNRFGNGAGLKSDSKSLSTALQIAHSFSDYMQWNTTLGINSDEVMTNGSFPSEFTTDRDSVGTELVMKTGDSSRLTIGVDRYEESINSNNDYDLTERDNTGLFSQYHTQMDKVGLVASLRYDDNSAYGSDSNGSLALSYNFSDNLRAVASYGTAFVAPSFNFLYYPNFGNPDILPEESKSSELSLLGNTDKLNWRVSAYNTDVTNLFSFNPVSYLAANVGEAELKGVEFEVKTKIAEWQLGLNADLLSAKNKVTNVELDDRAEKTIALTANRNYGDFDFGVALKHESGRFDNGGTELNSYTLLDLTARYQFNDNLVIAAKIDNAFDKDYTVNLLGKDNRYNTEGREAKLTFQYKF